MRVLHVVLLVLGLAWPAVALAQTQSAASGTTYRVFLSTGEPLPSYGEPAFVGDRVIFNLLLGATDGVPEVQLVSLPTTGVDMERTARYAHSMRASHYAATRGEADYAALTAEVARALDRLTTVNDPRQRLTLAEDAQRTLLWWSNEHFQYRADDIRELASLFEDVIAELRVAAGMSGVSFALVAGTPRLDPLLPEPGTQEALNMALAAATVADVGVERVEILRKASAIADLAADPAMSRIVAERLGDEINAGTAYAALIAAMRSRADEARRRGDVAAVRRLTQELERQDGVLGRRRPAEVEAFKTHLSATLESTQAFRRALDEHARQRTDLRRYDGQVRPLLSRFDRQALVLGALRDRRGVTPGQLAAADAELLRLEQALAQVRPPVPQAGAHATLQSAIRMAREACARRRLAKSSQSSEIREASAAASGALLLSSQVRTDLAASLRRPTIQ